MKSATVAPEGKRYKYYGIEYRMPAKVMAAAVNVSVRTMKDALKLRSMGYEDKINQGWSAAQCYADAEVERRRRATPRVADMDDAVYEIKRLRELLLDLGVDPDG